MPQAITSNMAMFDNIRGKITQDMIDTINKSPTLVSELNQYNAAVIDHSAGAFIWNPTPGKGSYFDPNANQIVFDPQDRWANGQSFSFVNPGGSQGEIGAAGGFVGVLAHEMGHYVNKGTDQQARDSLDPNDPNYVTDRASLGMRIEGEGGYNNYIVRNEVADNGGPEIDVRGANYQYGFSPDNNVYSNMLTALDNAYSSLVSGGADGTTIKGVLTDIAGNFIANQITSTTGQLYWEYYKDFVQPPAANAPETDSVQLSDPNGNGKYSQIFEHFDDNSTLQYTRNTDNSSAIETFDGVNTYDTTRFAPDGTLSSDYLNSSDGQGNSHTATTYGDGSSYYTDSHADGSTDSGYHFSDGTQGSTGTDAQGNTAAVSISSTGDRTDSSTRVDGSSSTTFHGADGTVSHSTSDGAGVTGNSHYDWTDARGDTDVINQFANGSSNTYQSSVDGSHVTTQSTADGTWSESGVDSSGLAYSETDHRDGSGFGTRDYGAYTDQWTSDGLGDTTNTMTWHSVGETGTETYTSTPGHGTHTWDLFFNGVETQGSTGY